MAVACMVLAACKKNDNIGNTTRYPDLLLHGFEIKDTLNPTLIDSNFSFHADGTLYSAADLLTNKEMDFTYAGGERQSNGTYDYVYDNGNLTQIALPPDGNGRRDTMELYANGYIKSYKMAFGYNTEGLPRIMTYTYYYGNVGTEGPVADPTIVYGRCIDYGRNGLVLDSVIDDFSILYHDAFDSGFTPLMTVSNDAKVHFLNLRLWSQIPLRNTEGIDQVKRDTYSFIRDVSGRLADVNAHSTVNFTYVYDSKLRPTAIIKDGLPAYNIIYHD